MSELDTKEFYDNQMDAEGIVLSKDQLPSAAAPAPEDTLTGWMAIPLEHTRSCQHWNDDGCTCALEIRIAAWNWMELHNAWRKRAEEAEAELNRLRAVPAPEDTETILRSLEKLMRCNTIHGDQPPGYTCLDDIETSKRWIAEYKPTGDAEKDRIGREALAYRKRVVAGNYACRGCSANRLVSRLRSQVETLREHAQIDATMHRNCCRERASLEQRTLIPDEKAGVIAVLQQTIRDCATLRMSPPPHIKAALRRLSSGDSEDTKNG